MNHTEDANKEKLLYIVKTLSRTKRKDYENYVVNAIYQRLNIPELKPASQVFIRKPDGGHYFIDLYFPQLNIGVECDEGHHKKQIDADKEREIKITDLLNEVQQKGYKALHIDICDQTLDSVNKQIDKAAATIKDAWERLPSAQKCWVEISPEDYFQSKTTKVISTGDDIIFRTETQVCNVIFGSNYDGQQKSYFYPKLRDGSKATNFVFWAPKLAVKVENNLKRIGKYKNVLTDDENWIEESSRSIDMRWKGDKKGALPRITFALTRNPVTGKAGYRFIGVFQHNHNQGKKSIYRKISDQFDFERYTIL